MATRERWTHDPAAHDYPAAGNYLSLLLDAATAAAVVRALQRAPVIVGKANDLLRASRLPLLPADDPEVAKDLKKVKKGTRLSPVLLLRGDVGSGRPLTVADGYHRICASYHLDEDAGIPYRLADLPTVHARPSRAPRSR